jgi:hypothetical protein
MNGGNILNYPATLTKNGDSISVSVTFQYIPEAITFGANKEEALPVD